MDIKELGLTTRQVNALANKNMTTIEDILKFFPYKYYDFSKVVSYKNLLVGEYQLVQGKVVDMYLNGANLFITLKESNTTNKVSICYFGMGKIYKSLFSLNKEFCFGGRVGIFRNTFTITNPIVYSTVENKKSILNILPVYKSVKGISAVAIKEILNKAIAKMDKEDIFGQDVFKEYKLMDKELAYKEMHSPSNLETLDKAKKYFEFEELFTLAFLLKNKNGTYKNLHKFEKSNLLSKFIEKLPFPLTMDQEKVINEIKTKANSEKPINALVQGDVGTGKTMIAFAGVLLAKESGNQSIILCPTSVLATQHYEEFCERTKGLGVNAAFLNGDTKAKERKVILKGLADGSIDVIIGTHAILSDKIEFNSLALMVVDEEHRFGVKQREKLLEKAKGLHFISMSATPIPRTLALTIYNEDIDVFTIKTKPANRKEVKTVIFNDNEKVYDGLYRQFKEGHQSYIVCPSIDESEDLESIEKIQKEVISHFKAKGINDIKTTIVTGKMKQNEVDEAINDFANFKTHILISTTVIEVGVNVPNATVMVIQDATRFGLAQLHQLRGRVGRGDFQSFCVLVGDNSNKRLQTMVSTTDGFEIAEQDLKLRSSGDLLGTKQSGENKTLMLVLNNRPFYDKIRKTVNTIISNKSLNNSLLKKLL